MNSLQCEEIQSTVIFNSYFMVASDLIFIMLSCMFVCL